MASWAYAINYCSRGTRSWMAQLAVKNRQLEADFAALRADPLLQAVLPWAGPTTFPAVVVPCLLLTRTPRCFRSGPLVPQPG